MDIRSKPTFVPRKHHLLFAFLLVCLLACLLAFLFLCLQCLSCLSTLCLVHMLYASLSFHCLFVGFLFLPSHVHTHGERTHGARARSPRCKQKGQGCEHVDISEAAMFSRFKGLASPIWLCMNGAKLQAHSIIVL